MQGGNPCPIVLFKGEFKMNDSELSKNKQHRIVDLHIQLPMDFPEDWDDDMINFHLNESSWCCSNFIYELKELEKEYTCICPMCESEVIPLDKHNLLFPYWQRELGLEENER